MERKQDNSKLSEDEQKPVHERTGSTLHNDYRITGDEKKGKDEMENTRQHKSNDQSDKPEK